VTTTCLIATDLSCLRLIAEGVDDVWRAPEPADPDNPPPLRQVAAEAADWLSSRAPSRRVHRVVLDVDEARCLWIVTPSREAAVVAAAVRQRRADWGEADLAGELVQPLVAESRRGGLHDLPLLRYLAPRAERGDGGGSAAVLEAPDAAVKLWLDALDARSFRVGEVASLWHLMARRSSETGGDEVTATVLADRPGRLVWVWSQAGDLLAAGAASMPHPDPSAEGDAADAARPAAGRLALDWLTWSAQLGVAPGRVEVVAASKGSLIERLRGAIEAAWPEAPVAAAPVRDPIRETIHLPPDRAAATPDPRRAAPALAERPSRPHRRVYRLAALSILLLAIAVGLLGWKNQQLARDYRQARVDLQAQGRSLVATLAPGYENNPDLLGSLRSYFIEFQEQNPQLQLSPPPRPVFEELDRLLAAALPVEGVTVSRIDIDDNSASSAQFQIASYADGEALLLSLTRSPGDINWTERVTGAPPNLVQRLFGTWEP